MKDYFKAYLPLENYDQDAEPIAQDTHLIICDGLGGDGSSNHFVNGQSTEIKKSAYLGSRKLSEICDAFYSENYDGLLCENTIANLVFNLKYTIKREFDQYLALNPKVDSSTGGGVFPTTLASAVFKELEDGIETTIIWAGDSRVYIFDLEKGLQQISKDDVIGEFDACFGKDCRMGNCVSQDQEFKLNYATYKLPKQCVLFVCSDGCFDFMPSPIHFELEIMRALFSTQNLSESFEKTIRAMKAGDDCTIAGCIFNISTSELQEFIRTRIKEYIAPMRNAIDNSDVEYDRLVEENKLEIRKLNSENRKLNAEVFLQIQNIILDTFRNDIENSQIPNFVLISNVLREYEPYNKLLISISEEQNRIKNNKKKFEEYKIRYQELTGLVDKAERQRRIIDRRNKVQKNPFGHFSIGSRVFSNNNIIEELERKRNTAYEDYLLNIKQFEKKLIESKEIKCGFQELNYDFTRLMNSLLHSIHKLERYEQQLNDANEQLAASILSETDLKSIVMPSVKKDGISVYKGYLQGTDYSELLSVYEEYKALENVIETIGPDGFRVKESSEYINNFKNVFLKSHSANLFDIIKTNADTSKQIPSLIYYQENTQKLEELQKGLNSGEIIKRQKWSEYRVNYELFKKSVFSGEV